MEVIGQLHAEALFQGKEPFHALHMRPGEPQNQYGCNAEKKNHYYFWQSN
jgi:hypothetical protein